MAKKSFKNPAEAFLVEAGTEEAATPATDPAQGIVIPKGYRLVKEQKSARLQLLVHQSTKDAIRKAAQDKGVSMNDLINQILDAYIESEGI